MRSGVVRLRNSHADVLPKLLPQRRVQELRQLGLVSLEGVDLVDGDLALGSGSGGSWLAGAHASILSSRLLQQSSGASDLLSQFGNLQTLGLEFTLAVLDLLLERIELLLRLLQFITLARHSSPSTGKLAGRTAVGRGGVPQPLDGLTSLVQLLLDGRPQRVELVACR